MNSEESNQDNVGEENLENEETVTFKSLVYML